MDIRHSHRSSESCTRRTCPADPESQCQCEPSSVRGESSPLHSDEKVVDFKQRQTELIVCMLSDAGATLFETAKIMEEAQHGTDTHCIFVAKTMEQAEAATI